jgi:hypothetical protein
LSLNRKLWIDHRTTEGATTTNQVDEAKGDAFQLKRQLNRSLIPYCEFKEQCTGLKIKAQ